jgi:hypothetical protein
MFKPYLIILFFLVILQSVSAQVRKVYIGKNGSQIENPSKAGSYILYHKMEGDSAWAMSQYDMHDTLMITGTFKDEQLTIPHGKFTFYKLIHPAKHRFDNNDTHRKDSITDLGGNFIEQTGVYLNGKKNGAWKLYNHGKVTILNTYQDDVLNGLYQSYNPSCGKVLVEGDIINNVRQGNWNSLSYYGEIMKTEVYENGTIVKTISYLNDKKFQYGIDGQGSQYDLISYLNLKLSTKKFNKHGKYNVSYTFNLTPNWKLVAPLIEEKSDPEIDGVIINELLGAPNWQPTINNETLKTFLLTSAPNPESDTYSSSEKRLHIPLYLDIVVDSKGKIHISYPKKDLFIYHYDDNNGNILTKHY